MYVPKWRSSATDGEEAIYDGFGNTLFNDSSDNPFGYCGEYYDEETGFIYLRARYYDPEIGRFISEDPVMDRTNWYVYCSNNPVKFVDPWGMAPGDAFKTLDDAAIDFGQEYYSTTDYVMLELATLLYSYTDDVGNTFYSYVKPVIGEPHTVKVLSVLEDLPEGSIMAGTIHQHPNSSLISPTDKKWIKNQNIDKPLYVVVPGNTLKVWEKSVDSFGNDILDDNGVDIWNERIVSSNLKLRCLTIAEKIALTYTYCDKWYTHIKNSCGFNCSDIQWPRTQNGIAESWNVDDNNDFIKDWIKRTLAKRYKE